MSEYIHFWLDGYNMESVVGHPTVATILSLPLMLVVLRESGLSRQSNGTRPLNTMRDGDAITLQGLQLFTLYKRHLACGREGGAKCANCKLA